MFHKSKLLNDDFVRASTYQKQKKASYLRTLRFSFLSSFIVFKLNLLKRKKLTSLDLLAVTNKSIPIIINDTPAPIAIPTFCKSVSSLGKQPNSTALRVDIFLPFIMPLPQVRFL